MSNIRASIMQSTSLYYSTLDILVNLENRKLTPFALNFRVRKNAY